MYQLNGPEINSRRRSMLDRYERLPKIHRRSNFNRCLPTLKEKDKFYTVFFDAIHPKLRCPVEAGNYTIDEMTMDLTPLSFLPVDKGIWIITFRVVEGKSKKVHMCLNTQTKIVRRRVKDWRFAVNKMHHFHLKESLIFFFHTISFLFSSRMFSSGKRNFCSKVQHTDKHHESTYITYDVDGREKN